jgi:hypothetical protein
MLIHAISWPASSSRSISSSSWRISIDSAMSRLAPVYVVGSYSTGKLSLHGLFIGAGARQSSHDLPHILQGCRHHKSTFHSPPLQPSGHSHRFHPMYDFRRSFWRPAPSSRQHPNHRPSPLNSNRPDPQRHQCWIGGSSWPRLSMMLHWSRRAEGHPHSDVPPIRALLPRSSPLD